MPRVDPASLAQKIVRSRRPAVVYDCLRLVHQLIPELTDQGLDEEFIDDGVTRDAGDHVAEGYHLAQLGRLAGNSIVQVPLQMYRMSEERGVSVDRCRMPSGHPYRRIVEMLQESLERTVLGDHVGAHQDEHRALGRADEEIDGGCLTF